MSRQVVHLMQKDLREHRTWLAAFFGLAVASAALVGSGIDAHVSDPNLIASLALGHIGLTVLHGALLVAIAVQLVQGDRLVGTTAFWLTRPVRRADLVLAKLGTAVVALVAVPILLDALAMVVSGLAWPDAARAMAEGAAVRLALVLPVMALASVTSDLAVFVVSAIAVLFASLAVEVVLQWGRLVPARSMGAAYSAAIVVAAVLVVGVAGTFAHQGLTRRRSRTVGLTCAVGLLSILAGNSWTTDFLSPPGDLEAGWLDPARVTMTMTPAPADTLQRSPGALPWQVRASFEFAGAPANVALTPVQLSLVAVFADGTKATYGAGSPPLAWRPLGQAHVHSKGRVEALLGGARLLDAPEIPGDERFPPLASLTDEGRRRYAEHAVRFDVDATLGAVGYRVGTVLPLEERSTGSAGAGRFSVLSAICEAGRCTVVVRDVMPASLIERGRQSRLVYVLLNKSRRLALLNGERDDLGRVPVFGQAPILTEHVRVTRRRLVFEAPDDAPDAIDAAWRQEAAIAALEMRDIGTFKARAFVAGSGR